MTHDQRNAHTRARMEYAQNERIYSYKTFVHVHVFGCFHTHGTQKARAHARERLQFPI
jgi:hypothetical protein